MAETTNEKEIKVADGLGEATPDQVLKGTTFSSESGFNQSGTYVPSAQEATYDNTISGLKSTTVQGAIDEVHDEVTAVQETADTHTNNSTIHITSDERIDWNAAKTHADSAHAPSDAQANVIEAVKVNGTALTPSSKTIDIAVPTKVSELDNDSGFKTTDNNTTYSLTKFGSTITLTGSDGSTTSVNSGGYIIFPTFDIDFTTGHVSATGGAGVNFAINSSGHLESEVL